MKEYRNPVPTVDIIIEIEDGGEKKIVLIERKNPPAGWAIPGLAFCCDKGITDTGALTIRPQQAVRRGEVAQMIFRLLSAANLL